MPEKNPISKKIKENKPIIARLSGVTAVIIVWCRIFTL